MECNREEAIRALDLAEKKFRDGEYEGAMKFALKAQNLFPSLPYLPQTLTAYQVHFAAVSKRLASGEIDWHAVLGVDLSADHDTMRHQFRRMCLLTHPDKNSRSAASEGAFKLVKEAWAELSSPNNANNNEAASSSAEEDEQETDKEEPDEDEDEHETDDEEPAEDADEEEEWENLEAKLKCQRCNLRRRWEFCRLGDTYLEHRCKNCKKWGRIRNKLACAEVPLPCEECHRNLIWESYRPTGFECSWCDSYYVVGVHPDWVPRAQRSRRRRFRHGTVSCPYCGSLNKYKKEEEEEEEDDDDDDDDDGRSSSSISISCKRCGLRSFIELEIKVINR